MILSGFINSITRIPIHSFSSQPSYFIPVNKRELVFFKFPDGTDTERLLSQSYPKAAALNVPGKYLTVPLACGFWSLGLSGFRLYRVRLCFCFCRQVFHRFLCFLSPKPSFFVHQTPPLILALAIGFITEAIMGSTKAVNMAALRRQPPTQYLPTIKNLHRISSFLWASPTLIIIPIGYLSINPYCT